MPYAIIYPDGKIKEVFLKPSPYTRIGEGERMVRYDPPKVDTEMCDAVPVQPVQAADDAVQFTVANKPADIAWAVVRRRRGALLSECDWTQVVDSPVDPATRQEWATYRKALRDITKQPDPHKLTWPSPPG